MKIMKKLTVHFTLGHVESTRTYQPAACGQSIVRYDQKAHYLVELVSCKSCKRTRAFRAEVDQQKKYSMYTEGNQA